MVRDLLPKNLASRLRNFYTYMRIKISIYRDNLPNMLVLLAGSTRAQARRGCEACI